MNDNKFPLKVGDPVLYVKGKQHVELGIVSSFNSEGVPFVRYHTGSTGACTPWYLLRPIYNAYAFQIIRKDVDEAIQTQKARRIAAEILDVIEEQYIDDIIVIGATKPTTDDEGNTRIRGDLYHDLERSITHIIEDYIDG